MSVQEAGAQRLAGRLLDLATNEPLKAGILTLRLSGIGPIAHTLTDDNGNWAFDLPRPGVYFVEAQRIGYESWIAGPLNVVEGDDLAFLYHVRPKPIELDPIEVSVEATRHHLEIEGFYERQRADFGTFLGPEEIEKKRAPRISDLLLGLPGVRLVSMGTGSVGGRFIQLRGSSISQGGVCRPRIFVDGLLYAKGDSKPIERTEGQETDLEQILEVLDQGLSIDDIAPPSDLAGVEVYRSATQVPVQFGGTSVETLCGVIVFWTKRGTPVRRGG